MEFMLILFQTFLLVLALGIDAFVCSFSYGANKIKIPLKSLLMINVITITLLFVGTMTAGLLSLILPSFLLEWIPFSILFFLGISKVFEGVIKAFIRKHKGSRHVKFSLFNLGFILQIYADYEQADADDSKELSVKEAIPLAVALGIDGLSVGFSVGLTAISVPLLLGMSFIVEFFCVLLGAALGRNTAKRINFDLSILGGFILITIALFELLH